MAVARAFFPTVDAVTLARIAGRGERSGVGVAGFERGGFLHDFGKTDGQSNGCDVIPFPSDWRILLTRPKVSPRWHGDAERAAFATPQPAPPLWDLASEVADAVKKADFPRFAAGLTEFNRKAGAPFALAQGGVYAGPEVAAAVEALQRVGATCVGQSSWGPTAFAIFPTQLEAEIAVAKLTGFDEVLVTRAASADDYANQADEEHVGDQHQ